MTRRLVTVSIFAVVLGLTLAVPVPEGHAAGEQAPAASTPRYPTTAEEFDELFKKVSNWGRWGKDDQIGAANLVTAAKQKQAASLVKQGISVSLNHPAMTDASLDNPSPWEHTMNRGFSTDTLKISYHGYAHSHMDALCHYGYKEHLFNGYLKTEVNTEKGCVKLGIEHMKTGVLTRGIIIDIPRLKGLPYLESGVPIYPEDLDAWEKKTGVHIKSGDVVFIRTGRWARRTDKGPWNLAERAGLHAMSVAWLHKRDIAILGSDASSDVRPSQVEGIDQPVHTLILVAMGTPILDNCDLEQLSRETGKRKRWDFLLTTSPLTVPGATGSPLNPIAIF